MGISNGLRVTSYGLRVIGYEFIWGIYTLRILTKNLCDYFF